MDRNQLDKNIDELLTRPSQSAMRSVIQSLPEDVPSMEWRSQLNETLKVANAKARQRRNFWLVLSPSAGLLAAAAFAGVLFFHGPRPVAKASVPSLSGAQSASLEQQLLTVHVDAATGRDVTGDGLNSLDAESSDSFSDTVSNDL